MTTIPPYLFDHRCCCSCDQQQETEDVCGLWFNLGATALRAETALRAATELPPPYSAKDLDLDRREKECRLVAAMPSRTTRETSSELFLVETTTANAATSTMRRGIKHFNTGTVAAKTALCRVGEIVYKGAKNEDEQTRLASP